MDGRERGRSRIIVLRIYFVTMLTGRKEREGSQSIVDGQISSRWTGITLSATEMRAMSSRHRLGFKLMHAAHVPAINNQFQQEARVIGHVRF